MNHLLSRRLRATLGHHMSPWDWLVHGATLACSRTYRTRTQTLRRAFNTTEPEWRDLRQATDDLSHALGMRRH